jgi:hypothetical protein
VGEAKMVALRAQAGAAYLHGGRKGAEACEGGRDVVERGGGTYCAAAVPCGEQNDGVYVTVCNDGCDRPKHARCEV